MRQTVLLAFSLLLACPAFPRDAAEFAAWVRSEYGVRQHYFGPVERQGDLDRFWFQRCEAADLILDDLDRLSASFVSAWERRIA